MGLGGQEEPLQCEAGEEKGAPGQSSSKMPSLCSQPPRPQGKNEAHGPQSAARLGAAVVGEGVGESDGRIKAQRRLESGRVWAPPSPRWPQEASEGWDPGDTGRKDSVRGSSGLSADPLDPDGQGRALLQDKERIRGAVSRVLTPGLSI